MHCTVCQQLLYPYKHPFETKKHIYYLCEYCFKKHPVLVEHQHIVLDHADVYMTHLIIDDHLDTLAVMHYLSIIHHVLIDGIVLWFEAKEINIITHLERIDLGNIYLYHVEKNKERWLI